jgi:hypothetical protein
MSRALQAAASSVSVHALVAVASSAARPALMPSSTEYGGVAVVTVAVSAVSQSASSAAATMPQRSSQPQY